MAPTTLEHRHVDPRLGDSLNVGEVFELEALKILKELGLSGTRHGLRGCR